MPEDIQRPPVPANWRPSADQQAQIANDRRLQGMSREDQYHFFVKPSFNSSFRSRARQQEAAERPVTRREGPMARITRALRGD